MNHAILCVDDEIDNVDALERLFRKQYRVLKATSGKQALGLLKSNEVTVIISDQRMPEMSGVEFLEKSRASHPEAIRILLTGYTDVEAVISAINDGQIYRYVTKPWDSRELASAVQRAVERYELHAELREKNLALSKALAELEILDEAKNHFMILINHELKTPLTSLLSFMDLFNETQLTEEQRLYLDRMAKSAGRLKEIIFDVLELVSAETGRTTVNWESADLLKLLRESLALFEPAAVKRNLTFHTMGDPAPVKTDVKLLKNALGRVLRNAVTFADAGTVVRIEVEPGDDAARVSITNVAKQIPPAQIEKILRPFSVDENIMNHSKGMGLGLSISRAILGLIKTSLEIHSTEGEFKVTFRIPNG